ncbi:MAG: hypothetical protein WBL20_08935 [Sphingobium sp.]
MEKFGRNAPLPHEMQGHWKDADGDEDETDLIIEEGEVYYLGQHVDYDYKVIDDEDGALTVSLKIDDESRFDDFARANLTELVITPEGDFLACNVKFACKFERV